MNAMSLRAVDIRTPSRPAVVAFLRTLGCHGQAGDPASLVFAERVIAGMEAKLASEMENARKARRLVADQSKDQLEVAVAKVAAATCSEIRDSILAGEHWREEGRG